MYPLTLSQQRVTSWQGSHALSVDLPDGQSKECHLTREDFLLRRADTTEDTEISYRGVPGIRVPGWNEAVREPVLPCRIPGLQTEVQESRVWKDLNDTESSSKILGFIMCPLGGFGSGHESCSCHALFL